MAFLCSFIEVIETKRLMLECSLIGQNEPVDLFVAEALLLLEFLNTTVVNGVQTVCWESFASRMFFSI